jgi:hypothetical protein
MLKEIPMKTSIRVAILFLLVIWFSCDSGSKAKQNTLAETNSSPSSAVVADASHRGTSEAKDGNSSKHVDELGYVGCWSGMGGGRIKITPNKIFDLGSGESAPIKQLARQIEKVPTGMQTGESYLVEASTKFSRSFLSQIIRLSFNSDKTVGIVTYDSLEDYDSDRIKGQGLFEGVDCN